MTLILTHSKTTWLRPLHLTKIIPKVMRIFLYTQIINFSKCSRTLEKAILLWLIICNLGKKDHILDCWQHHKPQHSMSDSGGFSSIFAHVHRRG